MEANGKVKENQTPKEEEVTEQYVKELLHSEGLQRRIGSGAVRAVTNYMEVPRG